MEEKPLFTYDDVSDGRIIVQERRDDGKIVNYITTTRGIKVPAKDGEKP